MMQDEIFAIPEASGVVRRSHTHYPYGAVISKSLLCSAHVVGIVILQETVDMILLPRLSQVIQRRDRHGQKGSSPARPPAVLNLRHTVDESSNGESPKL
jgi:hypothetical protein